MFDIILACDEKYGISKEGKIPWKCEEDLQLFRRITTHNSYGVLNVLIMGKNTALSLKRPLPGRINIMLSTSLKESEGFIISTSLLCALEYALRNHPKAQIFVIGGRNVVLEATKYIGLIQRIHLVRIDGDYNCDNTVDFLANFTISECLARQTVRKELFIYQEFLVSSTRGEHHEEDAYLQILRKLLTVQPRMTRNALTRSAFSTTLTFDLQRSFPLLTTKRIFWKGIVLELLFFLAGKTDNSWLKERGVHIWDSNSSKEFIEKSGLKLAEDDIGPMYGFNWRYYGAEYQGKDQKHDGKDQLAEVIDLLINDPHSRRIMMTTYDYSQAKLGVLYPCHGIITQFYVEDNNQINVQMYQRSADWFLGVPFNIASYALLLHIIVNIVNTRLGIKRFSPGKSHMIFGDYHLYDQHFSQALLQISRIPHEFPTLNIKQDLTSIDPEYFANLSPEIFEISGYAYHAPIKAEMVA